MPEADTEFVRALADSFPSVQPLYAEHLEDNLGEALPHLLLADVLRMLLERLDDADTSFLRLLAFLEDAFATGDEERKELISTGFVENLPRVGEVGDEIRHMLGPELQEEARRVA